MDKKALVVKYKSLVGLACRMHNLLTRPRFRGCRGNTVAAPCALMKNVSIHFSGTGNRVILEDFAVVKNTDIYIHGNGNTLRIGPWCHVSKGDICMEDDGNTISLGARTKIYGATHLAAIEGTGIAIGEDCLFSSDIHFRTGDSHSILDRWGRRINPSMDISLGDHVWVGTKVMVLKGARIPPHSVVGACAVVTGAFETAGCVLAGVPAKVVKEDVDWYIRRIPVGATAPGYETGNLERESD